MVVLSGVKYRPLGPQGEPRLVKKNKLVFHTMVGSLAGTDNYFRDVNGPGYDGTESHVGVGGNASEGTIQWQDTDYQADAQLYGNDDCISFETADHGPDFPSWDTSGDNVPPWTDWQVDELVRLGAEVCIKHDIPPVLIDNTEDDTRGIGYHRQGVDPYRKHGGEKWSNAYGKVCPGDARINQLINIIIPRIAAIVRGEGDPAVSPKENWKYRGYDYVNDEPSSKDHQLARVHQRTFRLPKKVWRNYRWPWRNWIAEENPELKENYPNGYTPIALLQNGFGILQRFTRWDWLVNVFGRAIMSRQHNGDGPMHGDSIFLANVRTERIENKVDALTGLVTQLIERDPSNSLTAAEITQAVQQGLEDGVVSVDVEVTNAVSSEPSDEVAAVMASVPSGDEEDDEPDDSSQNNGDR